MAATGRTQGRRWRTGLGKSAAAGLVAGALAALAPATAAAEGAGARTTAPTGAASRAAAADEAGTVREIDAFVRGRLDATGTPGAALAVIEDGRVVHRRGFGEDGRGRAVTPDTPFLWGSVSKPVTGLAVMQLVEAGRVNLDEPVRTYLPRFRLVDPDVSDRITVRHLLTNTSGIPASAGNEIGDRYDNAPGALADAVRDLARIAPTSRPGTSYAYSSAGYAVLGALVEEVSGRPFGTYLHERVLDPLGMDHAVATEQDFERERVAPGHRSVFGTPVRFDAPYDTAGVPFGHVGGSLRDLTRFVLAELDGGRLDGRRVLSAKGTAETQRGHVDGSVGRYGLGWSVGTLKGTGERMVWKDGALPGHHAMVVMLPDSDRAVIVLQNAYHQLRAQEFGDAAFGAAQLLSGATPRATPTDPLAIVLPWTTAGLAAALLLCLAAPALRRLPRRRTAARARSRRRIALTTTASVAATLTLAALLWWLPSTLGGTPAMALLWIPDVGWSLVTAVVLALLLAAERTALGAWDLRRCGGETPGPRRAAVQPRRPRSVGSEHAGRCSCSPGDPTASCWTARPTPRGTGGAPSGRWRREPGSLSRDGAGGPPNGTRRTDWAGPRPRSARTSRLRASAGHLS
ncbi:serine hydrolase domain-containing protein [Streptomyces atratus]|uniref:CubicO group peptidase, beta-lactamase class C family n=1 Tax=Streptomyces atratus TaxID=1893 RepID=A0A1K2DMN7_STRAR|nr:CubicO group peptidase, beta-lactamase class C family [Streptomyces atratus]